MSQHLLILFIILGLLYFLYNGIKTEEKNESINPKMTLEKTLELIDISSDSDVNMNNTETETENDNDYTTSLEDVFCDRDRIYMNISINDEIVGKLTIELFNDIVPITVKNFETLINEEYYDGSKFHRIIPNFMMQGGDFTNGDGTGGFSSFDTKYFPDENFNIKHDEPGLLSMANKGPDTNSSQFFITFDECQHLDNKHVVFGKVVDGFDLLYELEKYGTDNGTPRANIRIEKCGLLCDETINIEN